MPLEDKHILTYKGVKLVDDEMKKRLYHLMAIKTIAQYPAITRTDCDPGLPLKCLEYLSALAIEASFSIRDRWKIEKLFWEKVNELSAL